MKATEKLIVPIGTSLIENYISSSANEKWNIAISSEYLKNSDGDMFDEYDEHQQKILSLSKGGFFSGFYHDGRVFQKNGSKSFNKDASLEVKSVFSFLEKYPDGAIQLVATGEITTRIAGVVLKKALNAYGVHVFYDPENDFVRGLNKYSLSVDNLEDIREKLRKYVDSPTVVLSINTADQWVAGAIVCATRDIGFQPWLV